LTNSYQISVRATRSHRREARVGPVHSRTRLAFLRKIIATMSFARYVPGTSHFRGSAISEKLVAQPVSSPVTRMRLVLKQMVLCFCIKIQKRRLCTRRRFWQLPAH